MKRLILVAVLATSSCAVLDSVIDTQEQQTQQPVTDQQAYEILVEESEPAVTGLLGVLDPLVPVPLQPLVPLASSIAVMLLSKRSRRHARNGLKSLATGNIGGLLGYLLKAVGAKHTSSQTEQVADIEEAGEIAIVKSAEVEEP